MDDKITCYNLLTGLILYYALFYIFNLNIGKMGKLTTIFINQLFLHCLIDDLKY